MAMPTAVTQALAKIEQGPVQVMADVGGGDECELFVKDGVDLSFIRGQEVQEVDLVGVYDVRSTGDSLEFELRLPERSLNVLGVIFADQNDGTTYWGFGKTAGQSLREDAVAFRFRPWQTRDSATLQVEVHLAAPFGNAELAQKTTEPHMWTQTMKAFPDLDQVDGNLIAKVTATARS